jgi:hypothetical protein
LRGEGEKKENYRTVPAGRKRKFCHEAQKKIAETFMSKKIPATSPERNIAFMISYYDQNLPAIFLTGTLRATEPNTHNKKDSHPPLRNVPGQHTKRQGDVARKECLPENDFPATSRKKHCFHDLIL